MHAANPTGPPREGSPIAGGSSRTARVAAQYVTMVRMAELRRTMISGTTMGPAIHMRWNWQSPSLGGEVDVSEISSE